MTARLALQIGPGSHTAEQITSLLGVVPNSSPEQEASGHSAWTYEVTSDADDAIEAGVQQLRPMLERLGTSSSVVSPRDLVVSLHAKAGGAMYELRLEHLGMLAAIGAGVVLQIHNGADAEPVTVVRRSDDQRRALVSLDILSAEQSAEQITGLVGTPPTRVERKGDPVSRINPDGPKRRRTIWTFQVEQHALDPLPPGVERIRPLLRRLAEVEQQDELRYVFVMLSGRDGGARYVVAADDVALMAEASAGLALDLYNEIDEE